MYNIFSYLRQSLSLKSAIIHLWWASKCQCNFKHYLVTFTSLWQIFGDWFWWLKSHVFFLAKLNPEYIGKVILAYSVKRLWIFYFLTPFYQNFTMTLFVESCIPSCRTDKYNVLLKHATSSHTDQLDWFWTSRLKCLGQSSIQKLNALLI